MKTYKCPDCGQKFQEGSIPSVCSNCGCPSGQFLLDETESLSTNVSSLLESSNDFAAEKFGVVLANIVKVIGYIVMLGSVIAGVISIAQGSSWDVELGILIIVIGLVVSLILFCISAWLRICVNMSYRLTRIDNKTVAK